MRRLLAHLSRTLVLVLICAAGAVAAVVAGHAGENAFDGVRAQALVTGDLALSDSRGGGAILRTDALAPGHTISGDVTIRNTGTLRGDLTLRSALQDEPNARGRDLLSAISLAVTDVTGGGSRRIYTGRLDGVDTGALVTLAGDEARTYRFQATLPDGGAGSGADNDGDNHLQRAGVLVAFSWTLTESDPPPVTTTEPPTTTTTPPATTTEPPPTATAESPAPVGPPVSAPPTTTAPAPAAPQNRDRPCARLIRGTARADRLVGTRRGDRLAGLGGRDVLIGGDGRDCLTGNTGDDRLSGGRGGDSLNAGAGADLLYGGAGRDRLLGGPGGDRLHARDGEADTVDCGPGRDIAFVDRRDHVRGCERVLRLSR